MYENANRELRNIRITLVILTIVVFFFSGRGSETVIEDDGSREVFNHFKNTNMVDLGDGYFGILNGDSDIMSSEQNLIIYYYNKETNELEYKTKKIIGKQ